MPDRILAYNSSIKLVTMLCDPIHRTLSHYLHAKTLIAARIKSLPQDQERFKIQLTSTSIFEQK